MIISGCSLSVSWQYAQIYGQLDAVQSSEPAQEAAPETTPAEPSSGVAPATEPSSGIAPAAEEDQKIRGENGVLRLLQEGHFKPHAEMRLMEIFHRDLELLQAQNADTAPPDPNSAEE